MAENVVEFKSRTTIEQSESAEDSADAVRLLEEFLAEAKSGEIRSVAIAYVSKDHAAGTAWSSSSAAAALAGAASLLFHRILAKEDD